MNSGPAVVEAFLDADPLARSGGAGDVRQADGPPVNPGPAVVVAVPEADPSARSGSSREIRPGQPVPP
jgi:hypothetical protein